MQAASTHMHAHSEAISSALRMTHGTGKGAAARWAVHTSTPTPMHTDLPLPFRPGRSESHLKSPCPPLPHGSTPLPHASPPLLRVFVSAARSHEGRGRGWTGRLALRRTRGVWGSFRGNPSAPVPWERRVRPAPYVKNSGAAGVPVFSGCSGAGGLSSRALGLVTELGPGGGRGGGLQGPRAHVPFTEPESELTYYLAQDPGCESPEPGKVP